MGYSKHTFKSQTKTFKNILVTTLSTAAVALSIYALSGQTGDLLGFFDSSENKIAGVEADGTFYGPDFTSRYGEAGEFSLNSFYDLFDFSTPSNGEVLTYNSLTQKFESQAVSGGDATSLQGVTVSTTAPTNGQVLTYNSTSTEWEPAAAGGGGGISATNPADNVIARFDGATGDIQGYTSNAPTISDTGVASFADASHVQSERIGAISYVTGVRSTAFGYQARAGAGSTAIGYSSNALQNDSISIGAFSNAGTNVRAVAVGRSANASSAAGVAIGYQAQCSGANAYVAIRGTASGTQSIAVGGTASQTRSISIGGTSSCSSANGLALGHAASSSGTSTIAIGSESVASGVYSFSLGYQANNGGHDYTIAIGGLDATNTESNQVVFGGTGQPFLEYWFGTTNERIVAAGYTKNFSLNFPSPSGTDATHPSDLEINGPAGTGTGDGGSILLRTAAAGPTGSTTNSHTTHIEINSDGVIIMPTLPTSSSGLPSGALWNDSGTLKIVP